MSIPVQVTFRNIPHSLSLDNKIQQKAHKLERYFPHIQSCRVTVDAPHHHKHKGYEYRFHIEVKVPSETLVTSITTKDHRQENAYAALTDAFQITNRQLRDYADRKHKFGKHRTPQAPLD